METRLLNDSEKFKIFNERDSQDINIHNDIKLRNFEEIIRTNMLPRNTKVLDKLLEEDPSIIPWNSIESPWFYSSYVKNTNIIKYGASK